MGKYRLRDQTMTIFGILWRFSYRFLSARVWPGIGVIVTLVTLVLNLEVIKGILAGLDGPDPARTTSQTEGTLVEFSVFKQVRCPGGGDWLGRDRNRRSGMAEFLTPPGAAITNVRLEEKDEHYGTIGDVERSEDDRLVRVPLSCDPPDLPGAPGGWAQVKIVGTYVKGAGD